MREYMESIGIAVAVALILRAFVVEAFKIPSGSMIPTLMIGDHIFVNKFTYGPLVPWTDKRCSRACPRSAAT
jgi:signal peptidase I